MDEEFVQRSRLLKDQETDDKLVAAEVTKEMFGIIVELLTYCKEKGDVEITEVPIQCAEDEFDQAVNDEWFADFMKDRPSEQIFEMANAGNYLDIVPLTELASAKIASMIKGKSIEEIRGIFGVVNDFTPEEEALVDEENKFAEKYF